MKRTIIISSVDECFFNIRVKLLLKLFTILLKILCFLRLNSILNIYLLWEFGDIFVTPAAPLGKWVVLKLICVDFLVLWESKI